MQKLLSVGQVARRLHLSEDKVRALADEGSLKAQRTAGGHRRFTEDAVERYQARQPLSARRKKPATFKRQPAKAAAAPLFDDSADQNIFDDFEEWPEDEVPLVSAAPAPAPVRPQAVPSPTIRDRSQEEAEERRRQAATESARLQALKAYGTASIPYDVPVTVRSKIVEELEAYVTRDRLPAWVSTWEQHTLVKGRVDALVEAHRKRVRDEAERARAEEARKAAAAKASRAAQDAAAKAKGEAERQVRELIAHGKKYAEDGLREFTGLDRWEIRSEIENTLQEEVEADWTERDVEALVDEVLDDEAEDEEELD